MYAMKEKLSALLTGHPESLVILSSRPPLRKQHDSYYPYDAGANFRFLTGLNIHPCVCILLPSQELHVFLPTHDPKHDLWDGPRVDTSNASDIPADAIHPIEHLLSWLTQHAHGIKNWRGDPTTKTTLLEYGAIPAWINWQDTSGILAAMRHIKDEDAIRSIQRAVDISVLSHSTLMQCVSEDAFESALEGLFLATGYTHGVRELAYDPIVACGANATILHYRHNMSSAVSGDWLLVDAGWAYDGYASDITRTYPVNKRASGLKREAYACVLDVQQHAIRSIKPAINWDEITQQAIDRLLYNTIHAGILPKNATADTLKRYFPHKLGHWLGMEVHDPNPYRSDDGQSILWQPGMVVTIEPGLYFPANDPNIPDALRGFGVRIEDDILVTHHGARNLSQALPVDLDDIAHVVY